MEPMRFHLDRGRRCMGLFAVGRLGDASRLHRLWIKAGASTAQHFLPLKDAPGLAAMRLLHVAGALALLTCVFAVVGLPMPPRRRVRRPATIQVGQPDPAAAGISDYERIYRSYLVPLNLYTEHPPQYAPVVSSRGRDALHPPPAIYNHYLFTHPAYINPDSSSSLDPLLKRAEAMLHRRTPPTRREQSTSPSPL